MHTSGSGEPVAASVTVPAIAPASTSFSLKVSAPAAPSYPPTWNAKVTPASAANTAIDCALNTSSLQATGESDARSLPVQTARTVSKSLPRVSARRTTSVAGVNRYHTDFAAGPHWGGGSPGSAVASTVDWAPWYGIAPIVVPAANASFGGGAAPAVPGRDHSARPVMAGGGDRPLPRCRPPPPPPPPA